MPVSTQVRLDYKMDWEDFLVKKGNIEDLLVNMFLQIQGYKERMD